jgi:hypothetical protein
MAERERGELARLKGSKQTVIDDKVSFLERKIAKVAEKAAF